MRINQFLAKSLGISRRYADDLIGHKRVKVNGKPAEFHNQIQDNDSVEWLDEGKWKPINLPSKSQTMLFYKPIFTITSKKGQFNRKTIYDRLPKTLHHLKPAGRLDYMSEGLLVLSNDGGLLQKLTHPKFEHTKTYLVGLKEAINKADIKKLENGVEIDGYGTNPVEIDKASNKTIDEFDYLKLQKNLVWYEFKLTEGRNNQIRKMCEYADRKVQRLIRIQQGKYTMSEDLWKKKVTKVPTKQKLQ